MRVLVTGGTGYVGPAIVRELLGRGHEVTLLVHRSRGPFRGDEAGLRSVDGDVTDAAGVRRAMAGQDAAVHLVAIRRGAGRDFTRMHTEATRTVLEAAKAAGVRRFLHMSAHGARPEGTPYQRTKWEAEQLVQRSGLPWTIFRPTFITGPAEGDAGGFDHEFAGMAKGLGVPSFGGGLFRLQPIAKRDVAKAFGSALGGAVAVNQIYVLAGPEVVTWNEYVQRLGEALGRRPRLLPAPRGLVLAGAGLLGGFDWFPASRDELVMLMEDHTGDPGPAVRDLGLRLTPLQDALRDAVQHPPAGPPRRKAKGKPRGA